MRSMDVSAIEKSLQEAFPGCELELQPDGNKLGLKIISEVFASLSPVQRQRRVYALLNERIMSGEIHAVSMIARTPEEAD